MPNWNFNSVSVDAPVAEVKTYLVKRKKQYFFNMHLLYPDKFPSGDPTGEKGWDYDWYVENTGSKWPPEVDTPCSNGDLGTQLYYDTARAPNNLTLKRLHELTGWTIVNEYEEGGIGFEGTFDCARGTCRDEEREFQPSCEICEEKKPRVCYDEDVDDMICKKCWKEHKASN